jgi:hypothetical protein
MKLQIKECTGFTKEQGGTPHEEGTARILIQVLWITQIIQGTEHPQD